MSAPAGSLRSRARSGYQPQARASGAAGTYNIVYDLGDGCYVADYGGPTLTSVLTVVAATPTPSSIIPTYTPTAVNTPVPPAIGLTGVGPDAIPTVNIGSSITLNYTINNTSGSTASVRLAARIVPSGKEGYGAIDDIANQVTVSAPAGVNNFNRSFAVPLTAPQGSYDIIYSLVNPSNGNVLDTLTVKNILWVNVTGNVAGFANTGLTAWGLTANTITLQAGIIDQITGTMTINVSVGQPQKVILRMRIKPHSGTIWVTDLSSDTYVQVPSGNSNWQVGFPIPRYLASGAYDVIWELGDATYTGTVDNQQLNSVLTITNPTVLPNAGVPIMMYHTINPTIFGNNYVLQCNFTAQMQYLVDNGWHTVVGEDIYNYVYKGIALPTKPIWLTFDNSYQNVYDYALPAIQSRGLKGSISR